MLLTDTGPIVALINVGDPFHERCNSLLGSLPPEPLLTTQMCFTEAMYLLGKLGGLRYQNVLWEWYIARRLALHNSMPEEFLRMHELMRQYEDTPMDLADASLVAAAECLSINRIFALDTDFYVYRLGDGSALDIIR
ncbi:MAG: PIN domain-containing protein [Chloroflexi bacterium]|nr:PIN domain-containing protein [Chloroflexota bacterium]